MIRNYNPMFLQNLHPALAMYKHKLVTNKMSFDSFNELVSMGKELEMLDFWGDLGQIAKQHPCGFCGGQILMRKSQQGNSWYWIWKSC